MHDLEQQEAASRPELRARLVDIYKLGQGRYLRLLLSTADIRQVGQASRILSALAKLDADRVATHQRTLAELKTHARGPRAARQPPDRADGGSRTRAERRSIARPNRAAPSSATSTRAAISTRSSPASCRPPSRSCRRRCATCRPGRLPLNPCPLPLRPFRGDLDWPVAGTLARRPSRAAGASTPNGIDIAAAEGSPVAAIHDGVVAFADTFAGFGNLVIVDHGAQSFSLYGDLLDMAVKKGARVERGQAVGTVGPAPTGPPELYFELRVDGQPVDPLQWLKKR